MQSMCGFDDRGTNRERSSSWLASCAGTQPKTPAFLVFRSGRHTDENSPSSRRRTTERMNERHPAIRMSFLLLLALIVTNQKKCPDRMFKALIICIDSENQIAMVVDRGLRHDKCKEK